LKRNQQDNK